MDGPAFLATVCGGGNHALAIRAEGKDGTWLRHTLCDPADAGRIALMIARFAGSDLWFCPTRLAPPEVRSGSVRRLEYAETAQALWADIDFKNYGSAAEAMQAIKASAFLATCKPCVAVASGGGLHLYWLLDEPIGREIWLPMARALVAKLRPEVRIDPQVSVNFVSLLRVPGTLNTKYTPPVRVRAQSLRAPYTVAELRGLLGASLSNVVALPTRAAPASGNDDLVAGIEMRKPSAAAVAALCPALADSLARGGEGDSYALWKNILHVLAYCDGGRDVALAASRGDSRFDAGTFEKFWRQSLDLVGGPVGPTTCATFAGLCGHCAACPHFGQVKSPVSLGHVEVPSPSPSPSPSRAGAVPSSPPGPAGMGVAPPRTPTFVMNGATYGYVPAEDGTSSVVRKIADVTWDAFEIVTDKLGTRVLKFRVTNEAGTAEEHIPVEKLADPNRLHGALLQAGVAVNDTTKKLARSAMLDWMAFLQRSALPPAPRFYGWLDTDRFAYGGNVVCRDGSLKRSAAAEVPFSDGYCAMGAPDTWVEAMRRVAADPRTTTHLMLAGSLAAPLLRFTGHSGYLLCFVSSRSGVGKSTIMKAAASLWGRPDRLFVAMDDTANAVNERMAITNDLPVFWDEVRGEKALEGLRNIVFRLTQGATKARMRRTLELDPPRPIRSTVLCASNTDLLRQVVAYRDADTAAVYRMLQFDVSPPAEWHRLEHEAALLDEHFGHATLPFLRLIMRDPDETAKVVARCRDWAKAQFRMRPEERFWASAVGTMLAAAMLAGRLGLFRLDASLIARGAAEAIANGRAAAARIDSRDRGLLGDIVFSFGAALVAYSMRPNGTALVLSQPADKAARVFVDATAGRLHLPAATVDDWCRTHNRGVGAVSAVLEREFRAVRSAVQLAPGTIYQTPALETYSFDVRLLGPQWLDRFTGIRT